MSSSRPAERPGPSTKPALLRRLGSPRSWSLRTRLLAALIALLAFVCVGIGAGTQLALRSFLMHQLDQQVVEAAHRSAVINDLGTPPGMPPPMRHRGPGPEFLNAPGQAVGTLGAVVSDGHAVTAAVVSSNGSRTLLPSPASAQLAGLRPDRHPVTVDLSGVGEYRVVALHTRAGAVIVTGLPVSGVDKTLVSTSVMFGIVGALALVMAVVAGVVIIRRQLAPLSNVAAAAREVSDLELERGEVNLPTPIVEVDEASAHTEVGQVGAALNRMVERIAAALSARHATEIRVRQFVADASHELRTPLAAIQGYTELAQRKRDQMPEDVAHAMSRVESEARRMTHLVEDMLLLARLDAGRPLDQEPVDLSSVVVDAVSDAHIAGPDHLWSLDLPDEPVVITGDGARLHQVLTNLLANCRTHTPAGTSVTVSLAADGDGGATLAVVDDGPGIPPEHQAEIFGRFVRGDSSRSRRDGSTGLGLAIVDAVVKAHHGTIDLDSMPGRTEFRVRLPGPSHNGRVSAGAGFTAGT
ncbi:MAG: HAMP domain-containing histidine kinase [Mycobacteriaceae bacterium]|nr:HAMP domain-containing histidine kinase [Mycobacteriaceae bacterium]MBV9638201.1 HAMP domain-containing histidine kinase [Mycobacteriaceae bacterium]